MLKLSLRLLSFCVIAMTLAASRVSAQTETYSATAVVKTAAGASSSTPLTAVVRHYATSAERQSLLDSVKKGGATAAHAALLKRNNVGTLDVGGHQVPIKYAYAWDTGGSHLITLVTAEPIEFANMVHQPGYDVGFVLLELSPSKPGTGEFCPASKVHVDADGAIVTENSAAETVMLQNVTKK
jgi:ABC-type phosphate transport system substrate-binding protein